MRERSGSKRVRYCELVGFGTATAGNPVETQRREEAILELWSAYALIDDAVTRRLVLSAILDLASPYPGESG